MRVSGEVLTRHSENDFAASLVQLADAGAGIIHVRTNEIMRATITLRKAILAGHNPYWEWDIVHGWREFKLNNMFTANAEGNGETDFFQALEKPNGAIRDTVEETKFAYFVYIMPQPFLEQNVGAHYWMNLYSHLLPSTQIRMVMLTPDIPLPDPVINTAVTLRLETPGYTELSEAFNNIVDGVDPKLIDINDDDKQRVCYTGAGMTKEDFEMYAALAIVEGSAGGKVVNGQGILDGVAKGKTTIVNQNDLLELYPAEDMSHVGGMSNLKTWINKRKHCYSEEASDYGIEPPKGIVFVGPPGTGKSLTAKAVSRELGIPCVRFDFGRVFNSLVGKSEERVRMALKMVEHMAPCVLFVDEIDKGLGGITGGGSGDSGTSSRVLGTFLTWLNDCTAPVFTMVTANNIDGLPPELMRKGRFDEIFASGIPGPAEREAVLRIHMQKRGYDLAAYKAPGIKKTIDACAGFVPAEIEQCVKDALINAFDDGIKADKFNLSYVQAAMKETNPLSEAYKLQIFAMTLWAQKNARAAGEDYVKLDDPRPSGSQTGTTAAAAAGTRRVRTGKLDS